MFYCIRSMKFSVLVNESPVGFFRSTRGLRQGDPLSPFLFIMMSDVLSKMITKSEGMYIPRFTIGKGSCSISHLQFADDTMIFCDADERQLGYLRCILYCFEVVSGLKINFAKSEMFQIGEVSNIRDLAWILGCKIGFLPSLYLGLPLGASYKSKMVWGSVVYRISLRLDSWKAALLSKGGRLTLLKSTLASIPNYYLSSFTIRGAVANDIKVKLRNFLWNDMKNQHRYHLVEWKTICKPLGCGGLGVRSIREHNKVMLANWY